MSFSAYFHMIVLGCATSFAPCQRHCNALAVTNHACVRSQYLVQKSSDEQPVRTANSTREDARILDATIEALLKFPALRAKLSGGTPASKMIVDVSASSEGFIPFGKDNKHPAAVFMDDQFEKQVTEDVLQDLDRRNAGVTSWNKHKPATPNIIFMDWDEILKTYHDDAVESEMTWYHDNPDFAGCVRLSLPGYSRRRSTAVLRFVYSPGYHICLGSCLLVKVHRKWVMKRIEITNIL